MRNPIDELGPQLFLPMKYLDEVKNAPVSLFSFNAFSEKVRSLRWKYLLLGLIDEVADVSPQL